MQIANHDRMRNINILNVIECIRNWGPITKGEIQKRTGLSWGSISNITGILIKSGVLQEYKSTDTAVGRTPVKLDISSYSNLAVGLDINIEGITAVLIDLKYRCLKKAKIPLVRNDKESILNLTRQAILNVTEGFLTGEGKVLGIGVAMQGAVDVENGISIFSPHFTNWDHVPIRLLLEQEFGIPVFIDHDPNCMAMSEMRFGSSYGIENFILIRLSMGIGASIVIDGRIYRGENGNAGEFGHVTVNPNGPQCSCGSKGCLEVYASGTSILKKAYENLNMNQAPILKAIVTGTTVLELEQVAQAARQGDTYCLDAFNQAGYYVGLGISKLINILNPALIVIGGEMTKYSDLYLENCMETVRRYCWKGSNLNILTSVLDSNSAALGAAGLVIEQVFFCGY